MVYPYKWSPISYREVRQPKTDVLPLCYTTVINNEVGVDLQRALFIFVRCMVVAVALQVSSVTSGCEFPADWQGKWYESGVGDVIVTSRNVSRKGFCLETVADFYLLENQYAGNIHVKFIRLFRYFARNGFGTEYIMNANRDLGPKTRRRFTNK